jgi:hypothetical protein
MLEQVEQKRSRLGDAATIVVKYRVNGKELREWRWPASARTRTTSTGCKRSAAGHGVLGVAGGRFLSLSARTIWLTIVSFLDTAKTGIKVFIPLPGRVASQMRDLTLGAFPSVSANQCTFVNCQAGSGCASLA